MTQPENPEMSDEVQKQINAALPTVAEIAAYFDSRGADAPAPKDTAGNYWFGTMAELQLHIQRSGPLEDDVPIYVAGELLR